MSRIFPGGKRREAATEAKAQRREVPRKHKVVLCDEKTGHMGGLEEK